MDERIPVSIFIKPGGGAASGIAVSPEMFVKGAQASIYTPFVGGYVLVCYAVDLEDMDDIRDINGYDGTVRPSGNITRAEVAMIFWQQLKTSNKHNPVGNVFSDVSDGAWYAQAVSYLSHLGILRGYKDGTFKPDQTITCAEFAAIISRFDGISSQAVNPFIDITRSHWAYGSISSAFEKGWITGYPDGSFRPNSKLTRGEALTIVNRMLGRRVQPEDVPADLHSLYPDLPDAQWAFTAMTEASVAHD